jgi:hypothetical protein
MTSGTNAVLKEKKELFQFRRWGWGSVLPVNSRWPLYPHFRKRTKGLQFPSPKKCCIWYCVCHSGPLVISQSSYSPAWLEFWMLRAHSCILLQDLPLAEGSYLTMSMSSSCNSEPWCKKQRFVPFVPIQDISKWPLFLQRSRSIDWGSHYLSGQFPSLCILD